MMKYPGDKDPNEILPLTQAAAERGVSVETLRRLIKLGRLHAIQIGIRKMGIQRAEALRSIRK